MSLPKINLLCRMGWHFWSTWDTPRWLDPQEGKAVQYRKCVKCNKQQRYYL